jgi:hypothetical protein
MAKTQTTEVAEVKNQALAAPAFMDGDFGAGFEGADKDSFAIPFLQILQKMSPIADEDSDKYIPGLKAGMVWNTVTQKGYNVREVPMEIIPCAYKRSFILWGARDGDGGFKGEVTPEEMDAIIAAGKIENVDGKLLVKDADGNVNPKKSDYYADTRSHFVMAKDPDSGTWAPAILSLASSQIKASKNFLTALQQKKVKTQAGDRTPPTFANVVHLSTIAQSNDKGNWAGVKLTLEGLVTDPAVYAAAKEFYATILAGEVKADYSKAADTGDAGVSNTPKDAEGF